MSGLRPRQAPGEIVILDGGTGTELQRRGVPMHEQAWSAAALLSHPDVVRAVHEDYVRAGADVVIANTFGTNRALLERAGLAEQRRELNLTAVRLARQARDAAAGERDVRVAGSINIWHEPADLAATRADVEEQAALLVEGGVDLIALEMMVAVDEAALAAEAARATGLPVWVGLSVRRGQDGRIALLRHREPLDAAARAWRPLGPDALLVMHSEVDVTGPALEILRESWSGTLGAYAHMGAFTMPHWEWVNQLDPGAYADRAVAWTELGAHLIGGCCGVGPEYVEVLAQRLAR